MRLGPPPRITTFLRVGRLVLALGRAEAVVLVGRIHVRASATRTRRRRCRCACRPARTPSACGARRRPPPRSCRPASASRASEKPICFSRSQPDASSSAGRRGAPRSSASTMLLDALEEPAVVTCRRPGSPRSTARGGRPGRSPAGGPASASPARRGPRPCWRRCWPSRDLDLVEAGQAGLQRAQRLLHRLGEGAADRHRLADRLHRGGQQRLGVPGNFSKVKRGILVTT